MMTRRTFIPAFATAAAFALVFSLAACTNPAPAPEPEGSEGGSEVMVGMANPWSEAATAEEAGEGAGLDEFPAPDEFTIGGVVFGDPVFSYMDGIAQAAYTDEAGNDLILRKGTIKDAVELSGDYNDYAYEWIEEFDTESVGVINVTQFGNDFERPGLVYWHTDNFGYTVSIYGADDTPLSMGSDASVGSDDVSAIIAALMG